MNISIKQTKVLFYVVRGERKPLKKRGLISLSADE
jgi:hypothetical protein